MDGDKVGEPDSIKWFDKNTFDYAEKSDLTKGTCASVNWANKFMDWRTHDGVKGVLYNKGKS